VSHEHGRMCGGPGADKSKTGRGQSHKGSVLQNGAERRHE
jgi:hypothetical protein